MAGSSVPFVVLKGYHMGSKWFEEAFNRLEGGGAFYFEYEHCLRQLGRELPSRIAPPAVTLNYLTTACGCSRNCGGCNDGALPELIRTDNTTHGAHSDGARSEGEAVPAGMHHQHDKRSRSSSLPSSSPASAPMPAAPSSPPHRGHALLSSAAARHHLAPPRPCRATGVSFGALSAQWQSHIEGVLHLEPSIRVVVHVRSNHLKHGLSMLRTGCQGEHNHATEVW